jgi:predicted transposase YdaD
MSYDGEVRTFIVGAIVAITDRFMSEGYKRKLLEVLRMTQIEQWIREEGRLEGREEGREEGRLEGLREGELKKAMETAEAALRKGIAVEVIADITGLTKEAVLKLKSELN